MSDAMLGRGWGPHQEGDREPRKDRSHLPVLAGDELLAWDIYFAGVATIQYHPANPPKVRMSLEEMAVVADTMLLLRRERCRSQ